MFHFSWLILVGVFPLFVPIWYRGGILFGSACHFEWLAVFCQIKFVWEPKMRAFPNITNSTDESNSFGQMRMPQRNKSATSFPHEWFKCFFLESLRMEREISLILDYFGGREQSRSSLIPRRLERLFSTSSGTDHVAQRQKELLEAFQAHLVAQILWDFEEDPWEGNKGGREMGRGER